jgi:hypothetical protein
LIGLLLFVSGFLKSLDAVSFFGYAVLFVEFALGYALITSRCNVLATAVGGVVFAIFSVVNLRSVLLGNDSCDCFGSAVHVGPVWMLLVDVIAASFLFAESFSKLNHASALLRQSRELIPSLAFGLIILISIRIIVPPNAPGLTVGRMSQYDVDSRVVRLECSLTNPSSETVVVESAVTSCSCASADRRMLPLTIPPGGVATIGFLVVRDENGILRSNLVAQLYLRGRFLSRLRIPLVTLKE